MTKQTPSSLLLVATIAGGIGFVAFVALMVVGDFTFSPAAFLAVLVGLGAAIFLFQGFHKENPTEKPSLKASETGKFGDVTRKPGTVGVEPGSAGGTVGSAGTTGAAVTSSDTIDRPLGADATGNAAGAAPRAATGGMPDPAAGDVSEKEPDHGIAEEENQTASDASEPAPSDDGTDTTDRPKWTSSQLAGSQELAERKGAWRYEPDTETSNDGPKTDAPAAADPADGDIGTEPVRLSEPRGDGADDLKRISGVGPKLEAMLHGLGIYHFDQIAGWTQQEVVWVDEHLEGFKGRVSRDEWVRQAADLSGPQQA